ncbi:class II fructose-1,6-bisphosphate aldolase [Enterococcus sp. AZ109]|uniref:class II fructose-1,6-bisphosphate aldolase n=1 Tax=Enterococcus sp. AZ109 TaxID=2774634 RepID=UPI003F1FB958
MKFVTLNEVLPKAQAEGYAIGHFNINGIPWVKAILSAAEEVKSPVIIASSDRMVDFLGGFKTIADLVSNVGDELGITVPVVMHLDHGQTISRCFAAIDAGYSSVMYDGSHDPIDKNIADTKRVVDHAHKNGVTVEAEIGTVGGNEDGLVSGINYADFDESVQLVEETGIDALAAALGSVHGKYVGEPKLGFKEMDALAAAIKVPLVLHGASGIPLEQLKKAIGKGHAKVNINTEMNIGWIDAVRKSMAQYPDSHEPRQLIEAGEQAISRIVKMKMDEFGSNGKA